MTTETDLQFDGWTVNRLSGEMSRGGNTARLPQQPLRILLELFDHAGEVVTREHLVKVLWPAGIVDFDNGLNVAVRKLRVALEDVGDMPRYIETLPRVGYRFIGSRDGQAPAAAVSHGSNSRPRAWWALAAVAIGIVVAGAWWWNTRSVAPPAVSSRPEPSLRARELYLEGIHHRSRRDSNTHNLAVEKLEAAVREDPEYAEAWTALGDTYVGGVIRQLAPPTEGLPRARKAIHQALALDPDLALAHATLGLLYLDFDKDFGAAEREVRRALQLDDRSARCLHHFAMVRAQQGHVEEALTALRRARELEPMTLLYNSNYAMVLVNARRHDEAISLLRPIVEANPGFDQARSVLARALLATGDPAGAREQLDARKEVGLFQADLGYWFAKAGQPEDARREIARLEEKGRQGFGVAYDQAVIFTALWDLDQGCEKLTHAVTDGSILVNWMRLDPRMDPLRGRRCFTDAESRLYGAKQPPVD